MSKVSNERPSLPAVRAEALVDICPCESSGETWMQFGRVLLTWHDNDNDPAEHSVRAAVEITRAMTDEENANYHYQSDNRWNGGVFICRYNPHSNDWRALFPANDRAIEAWGTEDEEDDTTTSRLPKQGDSVRVERIYMSSEQQEEEAKFGEVTDNTDEDGLTSGIVLKANPAKNEYLVDVDDECSIVCSLKQIGDKLVLVERW